MKKKYLYAFLAFVLIGVAIVYTFFVTKTYEKEITVPFTMQKTGEQLNQLDKIVKWHVPFSFNDSLKINKGLKKLKTTSINGLTITVVTSSTISSILEIQKDKQKKHFLFSATPDTGNLTSCKVKLIYKTSLLNKLLDKGGLIKNELASLENLKTYMEDTRLFYGYEIKQSTVADTSFLFKSAIVPLTEKRAATKKLFEELIANANARNGEYNGTRIFYSTPYGPDKIMLFASIGVSKEIITKPGEAMQYKRMPFGKNLLEAAFQGPYKNVGSVYEALEAFKADHSFTSMAIPYQKFLSDGYDFADDQVVQMKVYYPIF
jgi:effector-binding domain-containing protein